MPGSLFGCNGMVGKVPGKTLDDEAFGPLVRLGDEIHFVAFVSDVQWARQFFDEDFAGFLGDFDGGFEIVLRHRQVLVWLASRLAGAQHAATLQELLVAAASSTLPPATNGACLMKEGMEGGTHTPH